MRTVKSFQKDNIEIYAFLNIKIQDIKNGVLFVAKLFALITVFYIALSARKFESTRKRIETKKMGLKRFLPLDSS